MSEPTEPYVPEFTGASAAQGVIDAPAEPVEIPAHPGPVVVPAAAQNVSRGRFVLVVAGVWLVAATVGAGLYYWWYHCIDKTMPVFVVLVYVVACIVGSLLTAMVQNRPGVTAMAIAMMSAPLASTAGAALVYGGYVFGWIPR